MTGDKKNFPFDIQRENLIIYINKINKDGRNYITFEVY